MSGSLSSAAGFVTDAFILPAFFLKPEDILVGTYTFLPWVRSGLGATVRNPGTGEVRAGVTVSVNVKDDVGGVAEVKKTLTLRGPGDVIGIDPSQIIRRYPRQGASSAEETFLAHIEFDRPELPWLFTPFAPQGPNGEKLDPWIALVVLDAASAVIEPGPPGLPPRVRTQKGQLQPLDDSWAFAHAQILGTTAESASVATRLTDGFAAVNLSRLICPRRLDDNKDYVACLVPAYDCGVKAGLGMTGGTLARAWVRQGNDAVEPIVLPVYDSWQFSTAPNGDFESLARKLMPVRAPWKIGRRIIDCTKPRGGMGALIPSDAGRLQVLKCALTSPGDPPVGAADESAAWTTVKRAELAAMVNRLDEAAGKTGTSNAALPRIGPRLYARFQRAARRIDVGDTDWFEQLNTTPTHRIVAGLGTRVVQKDQEQLVQAAWAQVGAVDKANAALMLMQYARFLGESLHKRHIAKLPLGTLAQVTQAMHGKIKLPGASVTVAGAIAPSSLPRAATTAAYRRLTRVRGPVRRFLGAQGPAALAGMVATGTGFRDFRRPYTEPDGIRGLSDRTINTLNPALVGAMLGVTPNVALNTLRQRLAPLGTGPSAADLFLRPRAQWEVSTGTVSPGKIGGGRLLNVLNRSLPKQTAADPGRAEAIGSILNGLAASAVGDAATSASTIVSGIRSSLPPLAQAAPSPGPGPVKPTPIAVAPAAGLGQGAGAAGHPTIPPNVNTPAAANAARLTTPATTRVTSTLAAAGDISRAAFADSLAQVTLAPGVMDFPAPPLRQAPAVGVAALVDALHPKRTVTRYAKGRLGSTLPKWVAADWFDDLAVQPLMAAPSFDRPMYEALDAYDREWLVPGLSAIDRDNFVTLLETNPQFNEAFLIGLSDEMGRELLWREYPTDQRGTYFKRFWNDAKDELGDGIHRFKPTKLGTHTVNLGAASGAQPAEGRVVFVIRGALLERYPEAMVTAVRAVDGAKPPVFLDPNQVGASAPILFHAHLAPNYTLVGFDLSVKDVLTGNWWFLIAEHVTAPRFGLDETPTSPTTTKLRNDLCWNDLLPVGSRFLRPISGQGKVTSITEKPPTTNQADWPAAVAWPPAHAGVVARVLLQNPIRAAFHGAELINSIIKEK